MYSYCFDFISMYNYGMYKGNMYGMKFNLGVMNLLPGLTLSLGKLGK
jgi:hypothetical protein